MDLTLQKGDLADVVADGIEQGSGDISVGEGAAGDRSAGGGGAPDEGAADADSRGGGAEPEGQGNEGVAGGVSMRAWPGGGWGAAGFWLGFG